MSFTISEAAVATVLRAHLPIYRWRRPIYQSVMLAALGDLWRDDCRRVLDVGGGTGIVAQAIKELFPVERVVSVDIEDRFLPTLTVETATFDGRRLHFPDGSFDCVAFNNVIHHVRPDDRVVLMRECRRVAPAGAVFLKDHLAASALDHFRLAALDIIGNLPFQGMVWASYLDKQDWRDLAAASGYSIASSSFSKYRSGLLSVPFPNRLEVMMKWEPSDAEASMTKSTATV